MNFHFETAQVFIPDKLPVEQALARTTHLCLAAHPDDIEIMALAPILKCFHSNDLWFTGVVMSDGRGSPRNGNYEHVSDEKMRQMRIQEQQKAAVVGDYSSLIMLDYPSSLFKDSANYDIEEDLISIIRATRPDVIYTHNLIDRHDTHVAAAIRTIKTLRHLPANERPRQLIGCEVWRSLDGLADPDKVRMEISSPGNLPLALIGVFDSQIAGGKRYDLATIGRLQANATFSDPHQLDKSAGLSYGMDLTPLIKDCNLSYSSYVQTVIDHIRLEAEERIQRVSAP
jgi:LmbE family N-acetylglucosaminyl deacetylase